MKHRKPDACTASDSCTKAGGKCRKSCKGKPLEGDCPGNCKCCKSKGESCLEALIVAKPKQLAPFRTNVKGNSKIKDLRLPHHQPILNEKSQSYQFWQSGSRVNENEVIKIFFLIFMGMTAILIAIPRSKCKIQFALRPSKGTKHLPTCFRSRVTLNSNRFMGLSILKRYITDSFNNDTKLLDQFCSKSTAK